MNKKLKLILLLLTTVVLIFSMSASAYAWLPLGGALTGGVANQKYYIGMTNADLITFCNQAVADWNYAVQNGSNLNFSFSRTYSTSQSAINFWGEYRPEINLHGMAIMYKKNGTVITKIPLGDVPYDYCDCILNVYYLDGNYVTTTRAEWREIAAHEMGHALGLDHTVNKGTLMFCNFRESTAIGPTADEVVGVDSLYG